MSMSSTAKGPCSLTGLTRNSWVRNSLTLWIWDGNLFIKEIVDTANSKGGGWVEYRWFEAVTRKWLPKTVYFDKFYDVIICSGFYDHRAAAIAKAGSDPLSDPRSGSRGHLRNCSSCSSAHPEAMKRSDERSEAQPIKVFSRQLFTSVWHLFASSRERPSFRDSAGNPAMAGILCSNAAVVRMPGAKPAVAAYLDAVCLSWLIGNIFPGHSVFAPRHLAVHEGVCRWYKIIVAKD